MFQTKAKINYNRNIKKNYYEISLFAPQIAGIALPGQFVNIKVGDVIEPLLRRPLSIHRIGKSQIANRKSQNRIIILYEEVGIGTEILARKKAGEYLDVIGPLGNGFDYRLPFTVYRLPILVAGGMGTAPLVFLAERIIANRQSPIANRQSLVLIGAKTKNQILCEREFKNLGYEVKIATDDGSKGFKGKVTDLLKRILSLAISDLRFAIYACGPTAMLKEISCISQEYNIPAQISLEAHMACGIGACMGCVVKIANRKSPIANGFDGSASLTINPERSRRIEYKRVCYEGPVFEASEIVW